MSVLEEMKQSLGEKYEVEISPPEPGNWDMPERLIANIAITKKEEGDLGVELENGEITFPKAVQEDFKNAALKAFKTQNLPLYLPESSRSKLTIEAVLGEYEGEVITKPFIKRILERLAPPEKSLAI